MGTEPVYPSCTPAQIFIKAFFLFAQGNGKYIGERIETYLIEGERGSGVCCLNGPAARKGMQGDVVIIISYCLLPFEEAKKYQPKVVFPKEGNQL